jgi:hypothetical protein
MCSCSALDLCLQTNALLDDETRTLVYNLFFKMFQSYHFKQCLMLSIAANYASIMAHKQQTEKDISQINVQVMTSDEMCILVFKNEKLRNNVLEAIEAKIKDFRKDHRNEDLYHQLQFIMHDLKYMARPESLKYCINETDWIQRLILICKNFYFIDCKERRYTMIGYDTEGSISE